MNRLTKPVAFLAPVLLGACNSVPVGDVVSKAPLSLANDGQYKLDISCDWGEYGKSTINDSKMIWTVKDGLLKHKKGRWDIAGEVHGDRLIFDGTRQSGKSLKWKSLNIWINFNTGVVGGFWAKAPEIGEGCYGTATKK